MAAVEVTLSGVLYDKTARTTRPVVFIGDAMLTGVGVGGGPIYPPHPGDPPVIWGGGNVPMPSPPIANVPGLPPMPDEKPPIDPGTPPDTVVKPPPADGGWGYVQPYGWAYFPMGGAGPKG